MNRFKKLSIVFSAFAMLFFGEIAVNIACGPEPDPYDYYVSYFHNNLAGDDFSPFAFTELRFLYDEEEPESEANMNSMEWARYLGKSVKADDVYAVMYASNRATDSTIRDFLSGKGVLPDSLKGNTYLDALAKKKNASSFYLFAKKAEPYAIGANDHNYWDPEPRDTASMVHLANQAEALAKQQRKDEFLRLRYAYQSARMYHYAGDYANCRRVYDQWIADASLNTALKGWALALKAGALRRLGEPAEAAYLFSKVFTTNPERRVQAYKNFHYIDAPTEAVMGYANTTKQQAAIWAIQGFNEVDFDIHTLESVYKLAPESPLVGTLLVREVNKLETRLTEASAYYSGNWGWWAGKEDARNTAAVRHAEALILFSQQLAQEALYPQPSLGVLAEAYVQWLLHHDTAATTLLHKLTPQTLSTRLADQYHIIQLLLYGRALQSSQAPESTELISLLQWLDKKREQKDPRFSRTAAHFYESLLAPRFMALGDTAFAALAMLKADKPFESSTFWEEQLPPAALEQLGQWAKDGTPAPWGSLFDPMLSNLIGDDYWDLLGTAYLRVHDYAAAVRAFGHLSPEFEQAVPVDWYGDDETPLYPDPFITTLNDYPKQFGKAALSKMGYAKAMNNLQQRIKKDPTHAAVYYFQLANGVYQTGAFGNAWQLISYHWSSVDNYIKGNYYYADDYHDARQAAEWYEKARRLSNDPEFKAKCTFMLAKCEQKRFGYNTLRDYYENSYGLGNQPDSFWLFSQRNKYFRELATDYRNTNFFQTAVSDCTYLKDFIQ